MPKISKIPFVLTSAFLLLISFFIFLSPTFAQTHTFTDIKSSDSYFNSVEYLARIGVVNGNPDGTFLPLAKINRAELTKLMVAMQGIEPDPKVYKNCFTDVTSQWFAPYVCYAKEKEWIKGYEADGSFKPANFVTGSEALKIILNPLFADEIAAQTPEEIQEGIRYLYDVKTEDWFAPYAAFAQKKAIIFYESGFGGGKGDGFETYFPPRGRVAQVIFRALLLSENKWDAYSDYLADQVLKKNGFEDLVTSPTGCYRMNSLFEFDFYSKYLESEYQITKPYDNFDIGYFCTLSEGGFLFSNYLASSKDSFIQFIQHLIRFNKSGGLLEDQSVDCTQYAHLGILALPLDDLNNLNADELEAIDCFYYKDSKNVYLQDIMIEGADPASFKTLRLPYSVDTNHAYYIGELVEGADAKTFTTFEEEQLVEPYFSLVSYAKDTNHVFYEDEMIEGADAKTFVIVGNGYSKDAQHVYYSSNVIPGADPATFELYEDSPYFYSDGVAFDKNAIYKSGKIVEGFDSKTMELIGPYFIKDVDRVYFFDGHQLKKMISETEDLNAEDFKNFTVLKDVPIFPEMWAKSDSKIYLMNTHLIEVMDSPTFEFINRVYSKDKNNIFHLEEGGYGFWHFFEIKGANPSTFEPLADENSLYKDFGKDATHVYYKLETLKTGDLDMATADLFEDKGIIKDAQGYTCKIDPVTLKLSCGS